MGRSVDIPDPQKVTRAPSGARVEAHGTRGNPARTSTQAVDRTAPSHDLAGSRSRIRTGREPGASRFNAEERATLRDLGCFRVIAANDLVRHRYQGRENAMQQDLRSLKAQGLVDSKTLWSGRSRVRETFYSLTPDGKRCVRPETGLPPEQVVYSGFVKPAELRHDAAIYRVYHREAARIEQDGGRIRRIVLDFELKKRAYSPLAKAKSLPEAQYVQRQAEIARSIGLKVVNGHIALPDLRIEYDLPLGGSSHVDLEVASKDYHGSHTAEKAAAGFRIYADAATADRLSRALEERDIMTEIFAL